jgi:hypothetical protein
MQKNAPDRLGDDLLPRHETPKVSPIPTSAAWCMLLVYMERTNIYLTAEERGRLAAIAREEGTSVAAVVRRILDRALGLGDETVDIDAALNASFGLWADRTDEELESVTAWRRSDRFDRLGL